MRIARIALSTAMVVALAACGSALADPDDLASSSSTTVPETSTTVATDPTVPDPTPTTTEPPTPPTTVPDTTPDHADQPGDTEVLVYLVGGPDADPDNYDCSAVTPVVRKVQSPRVLTGAIEALLAGPTAEERAAGYDSWFSEEVGWKLASVTISDGVARIDFTEDSPYINNAGTSCGSMSFLGQLDKTATQFPTVDRVVYSIGGDVRVFYEWLQRDVPTW